ncbi:hypothetical protein [Mobilicoccus pelagius]|uniref:Uncharacterized protein n=1 Tax=Mobilicoccus pelagius NBRC 104925 TaxID=1089455 RepID=H5USD1_9MICO|nr:hypothetical protein [Mobilicoccus pelagius]GAB48639.1 hypothetical protein MOPEL_078_00280 [Mobilicoccus pelagius NBRC 104925]
MAEGRALAVRVDAPAGPTVGALVVSPPVGREAVVATRTTTALALAAADAGFVAFTYSPSGEGDSADLRPGDDLSEAWTADLAAVLAAARAHVGGELPVHVVGLRVGACLLDGLNGAGPGSRVAWEPVSGRSFLRHHGIIRQDSVDVPVVEDGVELEGVHYTEAQAASLASLRAPCRGPGVLLEEDRRAALRIALGAPYFAHVPMDSVHRIVDGFDRGPARPTTPWRGETTADLMLPDGTRITERRTTLGHLPVVVTTCPGVPMRVGATFSAMGSEVKAGPGRLWADAARRLAPEGVVSIRADRSAIGEDTGPAQIEEPRPYTDGCVDDVTIPAAHLRRYGLPVVGVGVCAGAWSLLRAAQRGVFDEVVAVNPVHWNPREEVYDEVFYRHYHGGDAPSGATNPPSADGPGAADPTRGSAAGRRRDPRRLAAAMLGRLEARRPGTEQRLRTAMERVSKEMAIRHPRVRSALRPDVPLDLVSMLVGPLRGPLTVTLLFGTEEYRIFCGRGGRRAAAAARRHGVDVEVTHDPVCDHSLFSRASRERTLSLLIERLGAPAPTGGGARTGEASTAPGDAPRRVDTCAETS